MSTNNPIIPFGELNLTVNPFYNHIDGKTGVIKFVNHTQKDFLPFPGLRPFNISESNLFFGRDDQVSQIIKRLEENRLILLHSNAEGGKTSLLEAGLIPALLAGDMNKKGINWRVAFSNPGHNPIENLILSLCSSALRSNCPKELEAELLKILQPNQPINLSRILDYYLALQKFNAQNNQNLLIVIDQLEEFFLYAKESRSAKAYLTLIGELFLKKQSNTFFVLACDSRNLDSCQPLFVNLSQKNHYLHLLPQLEKTQIICAINGPLNHIKKNISSGLVRTILDDLKNEETPLSVLQFTLNQLVKVSNYPVIDYPNYFKIGGVSEEFNQYVRDIFLRLEEEDQVLAKKLFSFFAPSAYGRHAVALRDLNSNNGKIPNNLKKLIVLFQLKGLLRKTTHLQKLETSSLCVIKKSALLRNWSGQHPAIKSNDLKVTK